MWTGLAVLVPIVIALGVLIQRGALGTVLAAAKRARIISAERAERWSAKLVDVDRRIRELQTDRTAGTP